MDGGVDWAALGRHSFGICFVFAYDVCFLGKGRERKERQEEEEDKEDEKKRKGSIKSAGAVIHWSLCFFFFFVGVAFRELEKMHLGCFSFSPPLMIAPIDSLSGFSLRLVGRLVG